MSENDELVQEFLIESHENLDRLDQEFVELEQDPGNREVLGGIFRTIHTIKGTSGFLAFGQLEKLTHVGENLLSQLRDGSLDLTSEMTSALLAMVDAVREMLAAIEATGSEGDGDYSELIERIRRLDDAPASAAETEAAVSSEADEAPTGDGRDAAEAPVSGVDGFAASRPAAEGRGPAAHDGSGADAAARTPAEPPVPTTSARDAGEPAAKAGSRGSIADTSLRVDVGQLDKLMNLVGELVLARNQILQHSLALSDGTFLATCQRLNLITTELQEGVMKTRMQPIGTVWNKFPRVVRDLAAACQKKIQVEMEGKDTEVDKTILESIKDPLTHIVRNSCDHGIETPQERLAAGKPETGTIRLRAYHEGGHVNIEVADDGRGLDPGKIKAKALEKGVVGRAQADQLSDRDLVNLIFAPGFSTAAQVSNVSGRGVGMDVVRTNIEKIGGTVDVQSSAGRGTTLSVKIPLTLAIIPALVVTARGERFAIPQVSLLELVRLEGESLESGIETVGAAQVYRLRGNLLPLVRLDRELGLEDRPGVEAPPADELDVLNIVVVQAADRSFGLVVDDVHDTEEIVVKPLGAQLKNVSLFAGATIMGDGRVALILDVLGMAQRARVVEEASRGAHRDVATDDESAGERQTLLVFRLGVDHRMAIPLSLVSRLEEIERDAMESAGDRQVVQYRDQIMPLVFLSELFGVPAAGGEAEPLQVVVHNLGGRSVGLVVDEILDVVEDVVHVERCGGSAELVGSGVVQRNVTDLVDVEAVVRRTLPFLLEGADVEA